MSGKIQSDFYRIISFPRIHISLIGMNFGGYRINGGIGFSISEPTLNCGFKESSEVEIIDERKIQLTDDEMQRLKETICNCVEKYRFRKTIRCTIAGNSLPHFGLGSNTAIYLSCIEAIFYFNKYCFNRKLIVENSKRGGTSGIGINTYFDGGFVFDAGIKSGSHNLVPSSIADRQGALPLVINKSKSPEWKIGICLPILIGNKTEPEEVDFFKKNCPIDKSNVYEILYEATYGITSSVLENDYATFCKAINAIQLTRWKFLERSIYGKELVEIESIIKSLGADCVGMSSLGPSLFFMGENIEEIIAKISSTLPNSFCYLAQLNNQGRIVSYD